MKTYSGNPLVSIIIPVYNTEKYLEACLESIINQSYSNLEIIIVNDGSSDNSKEICKRYISRDSRIIFIDKTNTGVSDSRNQGIKNSSGIYLMFIDSDDFLDIDAIENFVNKATETNADLVISGNFNISTIAKFQRHLFPGDTFFDGCSYIEKILLPTLGPCEEKFNPEYLDKLTPIWARLYKRSIIFDNNIRFVDLKKIPSECMQFNFEYCCRAKSAYYIDQPLYSYRRNTVTSVTKPYRKDLISKWNCWINHMASYLENNQYNYECYTKFHKSFKGRIICSLIPLGGNALKLKGLKNRYKEFKGILNDKEITEALLNFNVSDSKIYWRFFFLAARKKWVLQFIFLTWAMRKILSLRKS